MFKFNGKFMTAREYAFVPYIDVYAENKPPHPAEMKKLHMHVRKSFTLGDFSDMKTSPLCLYFGNTSPT